MSYKPSISHYRRQHAPNKSYISPEQTITTMYKNFCESYNEIKISYHLYRRQLKSLNISFVKLGEEECEICDGHENHLMQTHSLQKNETTTNENDNNQRAKMKVFFWLQTV